MQVTQFKQRESKNKKVPLEATPLTFCFGGYIPEPPAYFVRSSRIEIFSIFVRFTPKNYGQVGHTVHRRSPLRERSVSTGIIYDATLSTS